MSIKLRWLGFACFEIVLPSGKVLITDPFIDDSLTAPITSQEVTGADYIALTHGNLHHILDVGKLANKFGSRIICSPEIATPLTNFFDLDPGSVIRVRPGDTLVFDDLKVETRRCQHVSPFPQNTPNYESITGLKVNRKIGLKEIKKEIVPKIMAEKLGLGPEILKLREDMSAAGFDSEGWGEMVSFVFQTGDNLRVYMLGTGIYEFMRHEIEDARPNVAMIQLPPNDPVKVAEFAAISGAEVVIPYHHDIPIEKMHCSAQELAKHLASMSKAHFQDIIHGQWYEIGTKIVAI